MLRRLAFISLIVGDLDVRGFQIAMDDAAFVRRLEGIGDLLRHRGRGRPRPSRPRRPAARRRNCRPDDRITKLS